MRFFAGVLLGLLLSGPAIHHHHVTEVTELHLEPPASPPAAAVYEVREPWQPVDGSESCVIDLLGGPGAEWDADDVLAVLDEAWEAGVSPCELKERE